MFTLFCVFSFVVFYVIHVYCVSCVMLSLVLARVLCCDCGEYLVMCCCVALGTCCVSVVLH